MSKIPLEVFRPVVEKLLQSMDVPVDMEGWRWMSQRCNVHEDTIYRAMIGVRGIDFDLADLILTRCHAAQLWHRPPLDQFYWTIPITCASPACTNGEYGRPAELRNRNGKDSIYCSKGCRQHAVRAA